MLSILLQAKQTFFFFFKGKSEFVIFLNWNLNRLRTIFSSSDLIIIEKETIIKRILVQKKKLNNTVSTINNKTVKCTVPSST